MHLVAVPGLIAGRSEINVDQSDNTIVVREDLSHLCLRRSASHLGDTNQHCYRGVAADEATGDRAPTRHFPNNVRMHDGNDTVEVSGFGCCEELTGDRFMTVRL